MTFTPERIAHLHLSYGRAQLGIDGNCGFALLGPDLQEGEAEFVEIAKAPDTGVGLVVPTGKHAAELAACRKALALLRKRLELPALNYFFGPSHPYGRD